MNKIVRFWLLVALCLPFCAPAPARAAAPHYAFSVSLGTYDDIRDETYYTVSTATGDDGAEDIALPFTFTYDGVGYTTGRISVNGWIAGGTGYTGAGYENDLASTVARPLLAPLWDDLNDDASSEIGYTILGTEPNRVVVVQWSDVLWEVSEGAPQNFQVRLYETTNVIQFIYGAMSAPSGDPSASIGINDATGGSGGAPDDAAGGVAGAAARNAAINVALDATMLYVDKDAVGANNGSSWADAFVTLQSALDVINANPTTAYEVWVAAGVYYPDEGGSHVNNDRNETFRIMRNNVQLYGGFAGAETQRSERNWTANPTILSGDIDGNDTTENGVVTDTANIQGSNAYHVLWLDGVEYEGIYNDTVLDGFIVTAGNADRTGNYPYEQGGGLYCRGRGATHTCSPTLSNLTFRGNKASWGGGMLNDGEVGGVSSPALANVVFRDNTATTSAGGMYNDGTQGASNPTLTDVTFSNNTAKWGGGMYNDGIEGVSSPSLTRVTFTGNSAMRVSGSGGSGGGMYNNGSGGGVSSPTLTDVAFSDNTAAWGGAMYNDGSSADSDSSPSLTRVTFTGNSAVRVSGSGGSGGGIFNDGSLAGNSSPTLTDVTFTGNTAAWGGGMYNDGYSGASSPSLTRVLFSDNQAVRVSDSGGYGGGMFNDGEGAGLSNPTLVNVAFKGNQATLVGGGMYNDGYGGMSSPDLTHVTFSSNAAATAGGGMYNDGRNAGASAPTLVNALLWGNTAAAGPQMYNNTAAPTLSYTLIQGGCPTGATCGAGMLDADPLFAADGYHITGPSPALDAGTAAGVTTDLDKDVRPVGDPLDPPDLGADEFTGLTVMRPVSTTLTFGAARAKIVFDGGAPAGLDSITLSAFPGQFPTNRPADQVISRTALITPSASVVFTANLALGYADNELRGLPEANLKLYRWDGGAWQGYTSTVDAARNIVTATDAHDFSPWVIGTTPTPTAVTLRGVGARSGIGFVIGLWLLGGVCFWQARRVFTSKNNRERADSNAR